MNEKQLEKLLYELGSEEPTKPSAELIEETKHRIAPKSTWSLSLLTISTILMILAFIVNHLYILLAPIGYMMKLTFMASVWSFSTFLGAGIIFNRELIREKLAFLYEVRE